MAMRFHRHDLSSSSPKGSSLQEQKEANAGNEALAACFYDIFHKAEVNAKDYHTGGY